MQNFRVEIIDYGIVSLVFVAYPNLNDFLQKRLFKKITKKLNDTFNLFCS